MKYFYEFIKAKEFVFVRFLKSPVAPGMVCWYENF